MFQLRKLLLILLPGLFLAVGAAQAESVLINEKTVCTESSNNTSTDLAPDLEIDKNKNGVLTVKNMPPHYVNYECAEGNQRTESAIGSDGGNVLVTLESYLCRSTSSDVGLDAFISIQGSSDYLTVFVFSQETPGRLSYGYTCR